MIRLIADELRAHVAEVVDLDVSEFTVLRVVARGVVLPSELAQRSSTHPTATSRTITTLVETGLLRRVGEEGDARRFAIELTDQGRHVTDPTGHRIRPELQRRSDRLSPDRVTAMLEAPAMLLEA